MAVQLNFEAVRIARDRYFTSAEKNTLDTLGSDAAYIAMCRRVASAVAKPDRDTWPSSVRGRRNENQTEWEDKFFIALYSQTFVPEGRFWANAGTDNQQLFNCDVLSPKDDLNHIYTTLRNWGIAHANGAGVGGFFGHLRHRGAAVGNGRKIAGGPCKVIKMYDGEADFSHSTGSRRAACMGILPVSHPDIIEFIMMKDTGNTTLKRFNISPNISDEFMKSISTDLPWRVRDHRKKEFFLFIPWATRGDRQKALRTNFLQRELISVDSQKPIDIDAGFFVSAKDLWELIAEQAWRCGDPGLIFIDTANKNNPLIAGLEDTESPWYIYSTNPCAEIPMADNEICMLGAINLAKMVSADGKILWQDIYNNTCLGIRFLDNGISASTYPLSANAEAAKQTRRVGLGIMGFADMLIKLGVVYGNPKSLQIADEVMAFIGKAAFEYSQELGREKGSFPLFSQSAYATGTNGFPKVSSLRNAFRTTLAPTGTTAILAMVSSSGEPLYDLDYERKDETGHRIVQHPLWNLWNTSTTKWCTRDVFVTALQIPWEQHIKMQAAFQKRVDNSISKTINMPQSAIQDDVRKAYEMAYSLGCKGITIYRDKSKETQVLNQMQKPELSATLKVADTGLKRERSEGSLSGSTHKVHTGEGGLYVTINFNGDGKPFEVFSTIGKGGSDTYAFTEAVGRLISIALQYKIPVDEIAKQLIGISGTKPVFHKVGKYKRILSIPDAIGKVLETYAKIPPELVPVKASEILATGVVLVPYSQGQEVQSDLDVCPTCNQEFRHVEGCKTCACGSKCD